MTGARVRYSSYMKATLAALFSALKLATSDPLSDCTRRASALAAGLRRPPGHGGWQTLRRPALSGVNQRLASFYQGGCRCGFASFVASLPLDEGLWCRSIYTAEDVEILVSTLVLTPIAPHLLRVADLG